MSEAHDKFLVKFFARDIHIVTEWKDDSVWKTRRVGRVACMTNPKVWPIRPGVSVRVVPV